MKLRHELNQLKSHFDGELHFDDLHKSLYATDASVYRKIPLAVAFPKNSAAIQQLITFAANHNTTLIPRTAGTSLAGQCVGDGIMVDVSKHFTNIISFDAERQTVTVQPGVIRDELNTFLAQHQLFFGPNTSTSNRCMIGGMVGNNSSGTTSIQYGVTRDKVIRLKTILANGEEVEFKGVSSEEAQEKAQLNTLEGTIYKTIIKELSPLEVQNEIKSQFPKPEIHRRNTGYAVDALLDAAIFGGREPMLNLCSLLCGSEGTLAFTTEITLQLDKIPPLETALVVAQYANLSKCMADVNNVMKHQLYTCELMDDVILNCTKNNTKFEPYRFFVQDDPKALLLLELRDDNKEGLASQVDRLINDLKQAGHCYAYPVLTGEEITMAMELRKAGLGLLGNMVGDKKAVACVEDTAVALTDLPAYIADFTALMQRHQQEAVYYAHVGAGELHLRPILNLKKTVDVKHFRTITTEVAQLTKQYGGSFSGEHGDGIVRAEFIPMLIGDANYQLLKRIKTVFDPKNLFNPGKIVDAQPMDTSLRYGQDRLEPDIDTLINFDDSQGILRLAEKCNGSGDCRKPAEAAGSMCPSYHATKDEKDTTRARANMLREVLTHSDKPNKFDSEELKEVFDLCLSCKACASECPSNVDISIAKAEFQYQYRKSKGESFATKMFAKSSHYNKKAANWPKLSNAIFSNSITARMLKRTLGIASQRTIPNVSTNSLDRLIENTKKQKVTQRLKVLLFVDEFTLYQESELGLDAYELLTILGYEVELITNLDSARALLSKGYLDEAKIEIDKNIAFLSGKVSERTPLVGIEPSAILGFRDEFSRLASDTASAKDIAQHSYLMEEFLASEFQKGNINCDQFTSEEKRIKIHVHCHQKALSNQKVTFDILNIPENYHPTLITSGCCGMAGSFGYEAKHYDISIKIGELRLFPAVRKASAETIIAANGTSCRHQIKDGTQRQALHPIRILRQALL